MTDDTETTVTKRSVLRAAGTALATGVGMTGAGSAADFTCDAVPCSCEGTDQINDCGTCDTTEFTESDCGVWNRYCEEEFCLETAGRAEAYSICPFDALSHETYVEEGRAGTIADICYTSGGCFQAIKVRFECSETWWIESDDLVETPDTNCLC